MIRKLAQALMMAYEANPSLFADGQLNIPESQNGVPDLLDEARWGLIWILSLQEESGVFRANEAVVKWSPEGPADKDKTERWIAGPSSSATAWRAPGLAMTPSAPQRAAALTISTGFSRPRTTPAAAPWSMEMMTLRPPGLNLRRRRLFPRDMVIPRDYLQLRRKCQVLSISFRFRSRAARRPEVRRGTPVEPWMRALHRPKRALRVRL